MLCRYRLLPGYSLTQKDLPYILTPNEFTCLVREVANIASLRRSLPAKLQHNRHIASAQNTHILTRNLRRLIERGEWVALSMFPQARDIEQLRLPLMSGLQQRIEKVQNPTSLVRFKTTPTLRHQSSHAASPAVVTEKSLDNKIIVEFAGQWPNNAASISISKLKGLNEKTKKIQKDRKFSHRSLTEFSDLDKEPRALYLTIPKTHSAKELNFLLADTISPVAKETEMGEWETVLVPVRPLIYTSELQEKDKLADVIKGYIYIFWKQKLWREVSVDKNSAFSDIDVEHYRNLASDNSSKNQRRSEGHPLPHFWLPYKIAGEAQIADKGLALLFSRTALPWKTIQEIETDPELYKTLISADELESYSVNQSFDNQKHIVAIDLQAFSSLNESKLTDALSMPSQSYLNQKSNKTAVIRLTNNSGRLGLILRDQFDQRYVNMDYQLEADGRTYERITDEFGFISLDDFAQLESVFINMKANEYDVDFSNRLFVEIGTLKPLKDETGLNQRLKNHDFIIAEHDDLNEGLQKNALKNMQYHCNLAMNATRNEETIDWFDCHDAE